MTQGTDLGADTLARLLRQRTERGESALVLESLPLDALARTLQALRSLRDGEGFPLSLSGEAPPPGAPGSGAVSRSGPVSGSGPASVSPRSMASPPTSGEGSERRVGIRGGGVSGRGGEPEDTAASPDLSALDPLPETLEELGEMCRGCHRCGLARSRTQAVVSDGHPGARVMVVGEAPGANEDATGTPFVGAAGKLLDLLLLSVGLSRKDSVYIANVIKCRPPGNRNPDREEIAACSPYLLRQIELVRPEVILAVGTFSGQLLSGHDDALGKLRGRTHRYAGIPLVVTYHPAALLRNSGWVRPTWDDLQRLRRILDGEDEPN